MLITISFTPFLLINANYDIIYSYNHLIDYFLFINFHIYLLFPKTFSTQKKNLYIFIEFLHINKFFSFILLKLRCKSSIKCNFYINHLFTQLNTNQVFLSLSLSLSLSCLMNNSQSTIT